ncbi:MAG: hypothetical protein EA385_03825 [Salinarimonadaceae bacterium]|nr:MAG: hypothetical protein EA385_03825 [Salinarimonadaceae bacterium]
MGAEVRSWFGPAVANVVVHPALGALLMKWMQIRAERDPVLADFWQGADTQLADYSVLFLKGEADYTYLHHGRYLSERVGFSMQGQRLSELRTRVRAELTAAYDRCTSEFDIGYIQSFADFAQDSVLWGRLCLPLRMHVDDPRILLLSVCHKIEDKVSIFRKVYEESRNPVVVASPVRDASRQIENAWIIGQNEPAAVITGVYDHAHDDLMLRSGPVFSDERLWRHFARALPAGPVGARVKIATTGEIYLVFGEFTDDFIVFHMFQCPEGPPTFDID